MDYEKVLAAEELFNDLERKKIPWLKDKVAELRETFQPIIDNEKTKQKKKKLALKCSYAKYEPRKKIMHAIDALSNGPRLYEEASENAEKCNRLTQDILHAMELLEADEEQLRNWAEELKDIRINRREAKDFVDVMEPLYKFALKNKQLITSLGQIHTEMQNIMKQKETRSYKVREKTSLAEAFEQADSLQLVK